MNAAETSRTRRMWPWILFGIGTVLAGIGAVFWFRNVNCLRHWNLAEAIGVHLAASLMLLGPLLGWIATPIVAIPGRGRRALRITTWSVTGVIAAVVIAGAFAAGFNLHGMCSGNQLPSDFPSVLG